MLCHALRIRYILAIGFLALTACGSSGGGAAPAPVTLTISAAASLTDAFKAMKPTFEAANPGVILTYNFGGSNTLATQITQGADVDVFASANTAQMQVVIKSGQVTDGMQRPFVKNRLAVILPRDNKANLATLADLAKPGLKIVLADKSVPVGGYAIDFLTKASADPTFPPDYKAKVQANVVSYETDVKAVFSKIQLGEADAGIVYTSDVSINRDKVKTIAIPDALNTIATYPIAPIAASKHAKAANDFIAYILSADGEAILKHYGFIPISG